MDRNLRIRMLLEAGDRVSRPLRDIAGGSSRAARALQETRDRLKQLNQAQADIASFRALKSGLSTTEVQLQGAQARVADLARQMAAAENPTRKLARDFDNARRTAAALKTQHEQESIELQRLRDRMAAAGVGAGGLLRHERNLSRAVASTNSELEEQTRRLSAADSRARRFAAGRGKFAAVQNTATGLAAGGFSAIQTGQTIAAPLKTMGSEAITFEERMADVRKVVDGLGDATAFRQMSNDILDLSTRLPISAEGLAQIVAAGGQIGLKRSELLGFAEDAAKMGVAFDMTADDAGQMAAKWRAAFGLNREGVLKLANQVNYLGNVSGAKTGPISDIVTRIGPLGQVAGLASGQIAAMGATLSAMGVEQEVAATGIKNMLLALTRGTSATKEQQAAFKSLGLDAGTVSKRMQKDASGTILDVLKRLNGVPKELQSGLLNKMFGSESLGAIAPMLTQMDALDKNFRRVGDGAAFAGSMQAEFDSRSDTTASKLQLATNNAVALAITVGTTLLPTINAGAKMFGNIARATMGWVRSHPALAKGIAVGTAAIAALFFVLGGGAILIAGLLAPFAALSAISTATSIGMLPLIGIVGGVVLGIVALGAAAGILYANWGAIAGWFSGLWSSIRSIFAASIQAVGSFFSNFNPALLLLGPFGALLAFIDAFAGGRLTQAGKALMQGFINGIMSMLGAVKNTIVGAATATVNWFKEKLGIHSPSRVFMDMGGFMMSGLDRGLASGQAEPVRRINDLSRTLTAALIAGSAAGAPAVAAPAPAASAAQAGVRIDNITIQIQQLPGQSAQDLAQAIRAELERLMRDQAAGRRASMADRPDGGDA